MRSPAIDAEVRLYDRLFKKSDPDQGGNFLDALNSDSCKVQNAKTAIKVQGAKCK